LRNRLGPANPWGRRAFNRTDNILWQQQSSSREPIVGSASNLPVNTWPTDGACLPRAAARPPQASSDAWRKTQGASVAATQSPETNAQLKTAFPLKKRIVCRPKSLPKLWTSCRRPPDPPRVPCEPVSVCNRTGLRPAEREIEKWRPETGAQIPPRTDRNTENYRPETGIRPCNPRECRGFSHTGKYHPGDPTAWLMRQSAANRSLKRDSLLTGKRTGNFVKIGPFGKRRPVRT
jgi:hypothetical protein